MPFLGEAAALGTALCWSGGSILFTIAARRVGALTLNQSRITLALVFLTALTLMARGFQWAPEASSKQVLMLAVSGWIGLTLGDWAYFRALTYIGPRLATLLMILAPPLTAILAVFFLDERLSLLGAVGMAVTLLGVWWVVMERTGTPIPRGHRIRGVFLASLGALGQATGLILSKKGMGSEIDPLVATTIRMAAGTAGVWVLALSLQRAGDVRKVVIDRTARLAVLGASILGPVIGIWLSLVAVKYTKAGIAATLMATTPIWILPLVARIERERISARAVVGAVIAVAGVGMIFLR